MNISVPRIKKLETAVINRIAAGEVVQRPSSAIKELLENSLDAGSSSITVVIKNGGLSLMQIQDNGHGIRKDDLNIVCERFTTSKLCTFDDLKSIATFGFRGEALASITHVAHVQILSRTKDSPCAYKAKYLDGKIIPLSSSDKNEARPCAGNLGTTITVEDLFYNMPTRKQAFKNTNDEYQRVLDVISKYSIRYGDDQISFTCKKHNQVSPDLYTPNKSSTLDNIKIIYGNIIARELLSVKLDHSSNVSDSQPLSFNLSGYISNANYSNKKAIYIFFINNRLVESTSIKKVLESIYQELLPKHSYPFVYLNISLPPESVDVNVHPTKREVHFLYEDKFLECLYYDISNLLKTSNESRTFQIQSLLPTKSQIDLSFDKKENEAEIDIPNRFADIIPSNEVLSPMDISQVHGNDDILAMTPKRKLDTIIDPTPKKTSSVIVSQSISDTKQVSNISRIPNKAPSANPNKFVRVDYSTQKINSFFKTVHSNSSSFIKLQSLSPSIEPPVICPETDLITCGDCFESFPNFSFCLCCKNSKGLNESVDARPSTENIVGNISCDGIIPNLPPSFEFKKTSCQYLSIEHLINQIYQSIDRPFYQIIKQSTFIGSIDEEYSILQHMTKLYIFNHDLALQYFFYQLIIMQFKEYPSIYHLSNPIDIRTSLLQAEISQEEIQRIILILHDHIELLKDYFFITISDDMKLLSIPTIIPGIFPSLENIIDLLFSLGYHTNWDDEIFCFRDIAQHLAYFYSHLSIQFQDDVKVLTSHSKDLLNFELFPLMKKYWLPNKRFLHDDPYALLEITSLEQLYKIFERC